MPRTQLFTSESVSMGHPDKVADQISDAVLDAMLADDPFSRVACETLCCTGLVVVAGEITTNTYVSIPDLVRETVRDIGYTSGDMRFDADSCGVMVALNKQSNDIADGCGPRGRRRPGDDVRLRLQRDARVHAPARSSSPTAWSSSRPTSGVKAAFRESAPMPRAR
jgi:S-adenosylmethionine synthetase